MAIHILSVLGTSVYEPILYGDSEEEAKKYGYQEYVQISVIQKYKKELCNGGKITVFLTKEAKNNNWLDRELNQMKDWEREKTNGFGEKVWIEDGKHVGLFRHIQKEIEGYNSVKIDPRDIDEGKNEDEIWKMFNSFYESIDEGDEIVFDITHGFRSIPMLAIIVFSYAKVMKKIKLKGICYGAYEFYEKVEFNCDKTKLAPIFDLTRFNDILDWTSAADSFIRYGNAQNMNKVFKDKKKEIYCDGGLTNVPAELRKQLDKLEKIVGAMSLLSDSIATCRGAYDEDKSVNATNAKKSIKYAYLNLAEKTKDEKADCPPQFIPLNNLLEKAKDSYMCFDKENNYQIGLATVKWCIEKNLIQQGYTALEESIKTYLCYYFGLEQISLKKRDMVDDIVKAMGIGTDNKHLDISSEIELHERIDELLEFVKTDSLSRKHFYKEVNDTIQCKKDTYDKCIEIVCGVTLNLINASKSTKSQRNDINHFGMREYENRANSDSLVTTLKNLYKATQIAIDEMEAIRNGDEPEPKTVAEKKNPIFINFSNHRLENWGQKQLEAAQAFGEVRDVPFPEVPSLASEEEIDSLVEQCYSQIMEHQPDVVMCQGEFNVTYGVVKRLMEEGITCVSACTERVAYETVLEDGTIQKTSNFEFAQFREYR